MRCKKSFKKLTRIKKQKYHKIFYEVHKKYGISKKTLFYMKEYGPRTNATKTIIKESVKILILASLISSLGGFSLEYMKAIILHLAPILIMLPAFNDMIGDFGTTISSKFSTFLHESEIKGRSWLKRELKKLWLQVMILSFITSFFTYLLSLLISIISNYSLSFSIALKVFIISILDTLILVNILFFVSTFLGFRAYNKKIDPNNFLIPITTSIVDFGNMVVLSFLVFIFF